jgi:hypothetical protein
MGTLDLDFPPDLGFIINWIDFFILNCGKSKLLKHCGIKKAETFFSALII